MADFDASDLEYLVSHFTPSELRWEAHRAEVNASTYHALVEDDLAGFFGLLQSYLEWARDILIRNIPKPKLRPGWVDAQAVKVKTDILSVVERYVKLRKSGRTYQGLCPFHSEKHGSFYVYPNKQTWHCFGACGKGGDVISFVMLAERVDFKGAVAILAMG